MADATTDAVPTFNPWRLGRQSKHEQACVAAHLVIPDTSWLSQRPSLPDMELLVLRSTGRPPLLLLLCSSCRKSSESSGGALVLEERRVIRKLRL